MSARERSETFAPEPASVRAGRHFVRDTLEAWGLFDVVDDAQLCVSEIITNAVCHAGTDLTVVITCDGELTVDVHDGSPELAETDTQPIVEAAPVDASSGRGLHIVSVLAREWGVRSETGGKVVWFRLALPEADDDTEPDETVVALRSRPAEAPQSAAESSSWSRHPSRSDAPHDRSHGAG